MTAQDMREALLPCPFCGSQRVQPFDNSVSCCECGATGPDLGHCIGEKCRIEAIAAWNRRALPFQEPGYILGPGAKLEAAIKQTFIPASDARLAEARGWNNAMLTAISHVAESRNVHTPGPIFKALNETMGKIDDARFAGLRRYQNDATEAAAKGGTNGMDQPVTITTQDERNKVVLGALIVTLFQSGSVSVKEANQLLSVLEGLTTPEDIGLGHKVNKT